MVAAERAEVRALRAGHQGATGRLTLTLTLTLTVALALARTLARTLALSLTLTLTPNQALQDFYKTTRPPPRPRPPPPPSGRDHTASSSHAGIGAESDSMWMPGDPTAAGGAALPVLPPPSLAHVLRTVPGRAPTIETCTAAAGATLAATGAATDRGGKLAARFGAAPARPAPPALPAPPRAAPPTGAASTSGAPPTTVAAPKSNGLLAEAKARLSEQGYRSFIQVLEDI